MTVDLERYKEAYKRGLLNEDQNARLEELERRGLVKLEKIQTQQIQESIQEPSLSRSQSVMRTLMETTFPSLGLTRDKDIKEEARNIATLAPYGIGVGTSSKVIPPVVTGVSEASLGLLEGQKLKDAVTRGIVSGTTEAGIVKGLDELTKGVKQVAQPIKKSLPKIKEKALDFLTAFATKADKNVLKKVKQKPMLTEIKQRDNLEFANEIKKKYDDLKLKRDLEYEKKLELIPQSTLNKQAPTFNFYRYLFDPKNEISEKEVKSILINNRPKGVIFNEEIIDKLFKAQPITIGEIKKLNSLFGDVVRNVNLQNKEKRVIGGLKSQLVNILDQTPLGNVNKEYSKKSAILDSIKNAFLKPEISQNKASGLIGSEESAQTLIKDKIKDLKKNVRTKETKEKILQTLDTELGLRGKSKLTNILESTAAQRHIDEQIAKEVGLGKSLGALGLVGVLGYITGQPMKAAQVAGLLGAKRYIQSKPVAKSLIKKTQDIEKQRKKPLVQKTEKPLVQKTEKPESVLKRVLARTIGQQTGRNIMPIARDESGKISNQEQIEKERGVVK